MPRRRDSLQSLVPAPSPTNYRPSLAKLQYTKPTSVQLANRVGFDSANNYLMRLISLEAIVPCGSAASNWHKSVQVF
jgi:hypothetical protein